MTATVPTSLVAAAFIFGLAAGFLGYAWLSAPERRRARINLAATQMERNYWRHRYHDGIGRLIAEVHGADNATYHLVKWEQEMES
jgi:hypothetical protein